MTHYLALIFTFLTYQVFGQDIIETKKGNLTIHPITHATMVMEWDGKAIYVDPTGGATAFEGMPAPSLILITDIHGDHFNQETLQALDLRNTELIVPSAVAALMDGIKAKKITTLTNGEKTGWDNITIEGIPMYNLPETADSRHPKGRGNGYVLTVSNKKVYISGDTEDIQEMRQLKNIDVAFVCMNLPYTMDINQAADAVLEFKPKIVYPYHYRGGDGFSNVEEFKEMVESKDKNIEVRLGNWYPNQ